MRQTHEIAGQFADMGETTLQIGLGRDLAKVFVVLVHGDAAQEQGLAVQQDIGARAAVFAVPSHSTSTLMVEKLPSGTSETKRSRTTSCGVAKISTSR